MKNITTLVLLALFLASCSKPTSPVNKSTDLGLELEGSTASLSGNPKPTEKNTLPILQGDTVAAIKLAGGEVLVKLYSKEAPNTVKNFLQKGNTGFYNNLTFHRVEPGFVVQGGDPKGNGTGGGTIKSELNIIPFKRGSLGLARTPANKEISNDSQFYICLSSDTCSQLSEEYVNFGEVISGMELVDKIQIGDKILEISSYTK